MGLGALLMNISIRRKFFLLWLLQSMLLLVLGGFATWVLVDASTIASRAMVDSAQLKALSDLRYQLAHVRGDQVGILVGADDRAFVQKRLDKLKPMN